MSPLGTSGLRVEDAELTTGRARFVADLPRPERCVDLQFIRSQEAHATITRVDLSSARAAPGVVGAYAADDLPSLPRMPPAPGNERFQHLERPGLAVGLVRFVGEAIAVVAADTLAQAEDAGESILPELEPLPVVMAVGSTPDPEVPLFEGHSNLVEEQMIGAAELPSLEHAPVRFAMHVRHGRLAPASIETRGILVVPEGDGRMTVWCSHQAPHRLKDQLTAAFGLELDRIRVVIPSVGGAFGGKSATFPEYLVAFHLAMMLGRPTRWIEGRSESLVAATHGRSQTHQIEVGADRDGRLMAVDVQVELNVGAYPHTGAIVAGGTGLMMSGAYRIPELRVRIRTRLSNTTPIAPYRGAGRPEATMTLERMMDELARRVGRDPAEVRRTNFIQPAEFPYTTSTGAVYDSGRYDDVLRIALDTADYEEWRQIQRRQRAGPVPHHLLGVGIASYVERSGGQVGSTEFGAVTIRDDGVVEARTGASSQGQGHRTSFAQIVAEALNIDPSDVVVIQGDTDRVASGTGTFASRSTQVGGSALYLAAVDVLDLARVAAAGWLEIDVADVRYSSGAFSPVGAPQREVSLGELARAGTDLTAANVFRSPQAFPYGTHVAVVEIDPDTGRIDLRRLVAVDDCGTIINPQLVEGQALGSMVQGIGQALFEGVRYDEVGQPGASSFLTYTMPSAADLPTMTVAAVETPNPNAPIGAKGAGESGCIGTPAAIVNSVIDALEGYDTSTIELPITPEVVWRIVHGSDD